MWDVYNGNFTIAASGLSVVDHHIWNTYLKVCLNMIFACDLKKCMQQDSRGHEQIWKFPLKKNKKYLLELLNFII